MLRRVHHVMLCLARRNRQRLIIIINLTIVTRRSINNSNTIKRVAPCNDSPVRMPHANMLAIRRSRSLIKTALRKRISIVARIIILHSSLRRAIKRVLQIQHNRTRARLQRRHDRPDRRIQRRSIITADIIDSDIMKIRILPWRYRLAMTLIPRILRLARSTHRLPAALTTADMKRSTMITRIIAPSRSTRRTTSAPRAGPRQHSVAMYLHHQRRDISNIVPLFALTGRL